jgi:hypothetical protein
VIARFLKEIFFHVHDRPQLVDRGKSPVAVAPDVQGLRVFDGVEPADGLQDLLGYQEVRHAHILFRARSDCRLRLGAPGGKKLGLSQGTVAAKVDGLYLPQF